MTTTMEYEDPHESNTPYKYSHMIFEIKSYASKQKIILTKFDKKTNSSTPSTFGKCSSPCSKPNDVEIFREHFTLLKLKLFKS
jgi:hypothetical protein